MAPTISIGAGQGQIQSLHSASSNVIVRTIIPENPCGYCGRENRNTSHFCRHCGRSLDETSPLVTEVCQVGYVGVGLASASTEQQGHDTAHMLLIMQGLCNTLQPPPRPFSLFAIAESRKHEEVELVPNLSGRGTIGIGFAPNLAIETIADVLLPLLAISGGTGQIPSQNSTLGGSRGSSYNSRIQPLRQADEESIEQCMHSAMRQANRAIYH